MEILLIMIFNRFPEVSSIYFEHHGCFFVGVRASLAVRDERATRSGTELVVVFQLYLVRYTVAVLIAKVPVPVPSFSLKLGQLELWNHLPDQ